MMATRMAELAGATPVDLKALTRSPAGPVGGSGATSTDPHISRRVELG